ncbi:hypothetical protein KCU65_g9083, partial [Aureobasidium melanogenum]
MPPIKGWFKSRKPLQASRKNYYEDIFGERNPEEQLEGVHIIDSESDSDPGVFSRRARRQGRKKPRITIAPRNNHESQPDRGKEMGTADGNEVVAPRVDRSTGTRTAEPKSDQGMLADKREVVTIDDNDDSDVEEQFVADLRNYAQDSINDDNEDAATSNQDKMDATFLAEVKRYAAQPPPINSESNDELLERINGRAQDFANQSPLGPLKGLEPGPNAAAVLPSIEQTDARSVRETSDEPTGRPSVEVLDDARSPGAVDGMVVSDTSMPSAAAVRDHSWDPSQGSDYVYSDEEAEDILKHTKPRQEGLRNDINRDDDLYDTGDEDEEAQVDDTAMDTIQDDDTHNEKLLGSGAQRELSAETAELVSTRVDSSVGSEDDDNDNQELIDLVSPTPASSEEPPTRRTRSSKPSRLGVGNHDSSISPGSDEALTRTRKRRFGLFASEPRPSIEPDLSELSDDTRPQRLRDLVKKRAREREEREMAKKKTRYNLRPRRQQDNNEASLSRENASMADEASETDSEAQEQYTPRRVTRSMTIKSVKKPIPRFKAARKTAWAAMGIVPKDDTYRRSYRQIVEVAVPKVVDRTTWSSTTSPQIERSQSPALSRDPVTIHGGQKMEPALAGKGSKRMVLNRNNDGEEIIHVTKNGMQKTPFVLID